jgi:site-specific DNA recombinase
LRVPATEVEQIVVNRIRRLLSEPASVFEIFQAQVTEPRLQRSLMKRATEFAEEWDRMSPLRMRVVLLALLQRVDMHPDEVTVHLRPRRLTAFLDDHFIADPGSLDEEPTLPISLPVRLRRAGKEVRMVIDRIDPFTPRPTPDPTLIKAIGRAHRFHDMLIKRNAGRFADLAKSEKLHRSYFSQVLRLAYLAPDITAAILEGRQPEGLTATLLIENARLPLSWQEQRTALGFA